MDSRAGLRGRLVLQALQITSICLVIGAWSQHAHAGSGTLAVSGVGAGFMDRSHRTWEFGTGYQVAGTARLSAEIDLRFSTGSTWHEGGAHEVGARVPEKPDWGGQPGETGRELRIIPTTLGLSYRLERCSKGRFWLPFVGVGVGAYDLEASFTRGDPDELREHGLFRWGWTGNMGLLLQRTSGLFVITEAAIHNVDVPRRWATFYDLSLGVGASFPRR